MSSEVNNNIIVNMSTKIWGPPMWTSLHTITFSYPINPTEEDKKQYKEFFTLVGNILPCILCKKSYNEFIKSGETKLDDKVMSNKDTLTKWLYHLHNKVNLKLGVDYGVTYDDICKKYNSYIVSCTSTNKSAISCEKSEFPKYISFKNSNYNYTNCVIIPYKIAQHYINYAKMRNLNADDMHVINNYDKCKKDENDWIKRNINCHKIITEMRENNIPALEESGEWIGLPTLHELKLIMNMSSTLDKTQLVNIIKKLPKCKCNYKRIYKLVQN
jgi:hypothetical protein